MTRILNIQLRRPKTPPTGLMTFLPTPSSSSALFRNVLHSVDSLHDASCWRITLDENTDYAKGKWIQLRGRKLDLTGGRYEVKLLSHSKQMGRYNKKGTSQQ